jgi:hypothetical protein
MTMRAKHRVCEVVAVLGIISLSACQTLAPGGSGSVEQIPTATPATSQPAPAVATQALQPAPKKTPPTSAPVSYPVEPGIYKFKARVENVGMIESNLQHQMFDGAGVVHGERCVFTGKDLMWKIRVEIQEVYDPLSFLQPGEKLAFVVNNADHVFGQQSEGTIGKTFDFALTIGQSPNGRLHYGPLTTPGGIFAKEGGFD